jgi:hypothetical protein
MKPLLTFPNVPLGSNLILFSQLRLDFRVVSSPPLFLVVKGPRSRRYGRTAALRFLVQPCDEDGDDDDDDDYYFLSIS